MLKLAEVIGSLMRQELGNKLPAQKIKSTLQPVILQELVEVSDLSFSSDSGKQANASHASTGTTQASTKLTHLSTDHASVRFDAPRRFQIKRESSGNFRKLWLTKYPICTKSKIQGGFHEGKCFWMYFRYSK